MKRVVIAAAITCTACGSPSGQPKMRMSTKLATAPTSSARDQAETHAVLRLTSDETTEGRVNGALRFEGALAQVSALRFAPLHGARLDGLVVRDKNGTIDAKSVTSADASGTRFELSRRPSHALDVSYSVVLDPIGDESGGLAWAEPIELRGSGEDLFVLPDIADDKPFPVELHLRTGGSSIGAASSFGLGIEQHPTVHLSDLRHGYFLAGDVGTATFHASDGDDIGGWLGHTAFDPRWVSAESVGIRSAVDAWVGRNASPNTPPMTFLFSATKRNEPPIVVIPRTRGLLVSADRRAVWNAPARIGVAQALTQRYVGGFLRIADQDDAHGSFFSDGFSRTIAREVLFDANLLDPVERAAEMNAILFSFTFAEDARRKATANGALVATALDVALRDQKKELRTFVRELLAKAANQNRNELTTAELMTLIREHTTVATARDLSRALDSGAEVALPPDLMGRCFRLTKQLLVLFELGFVTSTGEEMVVTSVKQGSRAEAAGVRSGDVVADLRYAAGKSQVPVELVVKRTDKGAEQKVRLRFLPAGPSKPGRLFERVPGVPNDRC
jgi:hypothetical protein